MQSECQHNKKAPPDVIESLPKTQAGVGRHRCAICAYETGYLSGFKAALDFLKKIPSTDEDILILKASNNEEAITKIVNSLKRIT